MHKLTVALAAALFAFVPLQPAAAEMPTGSDPLTTCQKLHSDGVGLVVRSSPSSKGKRVGSLEAGEKVQLDGEKHGSDTVYPQMQDDSDGAIWIKLKSPSKGWVLYASPDDEDFRYLIPCRE